jgi:hypothetical protein
MRLAKKHVVWCCSKWKSALSESGSLCFMFSRTASGRRFLRPSWLPAQCPGQHDRSSCRLAQAVLQASTPLGFFSTPNVKHRQSALPNPTHQFREQPEPDSQTPCGGPISSRKANARVSNSAQSIRHQAVDGDSGIARRPWAEGPGPPEPSVHDGHGHITMLSCGSAAKHGSVLQIFNSRPAL